MRLDTSAQTDQSTPPLEDRTPASAGTVSTATAPDAAPPAWFQRLRSRKESGAAPRRPKQPVLVIEPDQEPELTRCQNAVRWVLGFAAVGYGLSLLFHVAVLTGMSLIIISEMRDRQMSITAAQTDGLETTFDEVLETQFDLDAGGNPPELTMPDVQILETPAETPLSIPTQSVEDAVAQIDPGEGTGEGNADGESGAFQFRMPEGGKAVTKGSFTAWTYPEEPDPNQHLDYLIIIQIELPKGVSRYRVSDLAGLVEGTDKYRQTIPFDRINPMAAMTVRNGRFAAVKASDFLPVEDNKAQLIIKVPCGDELIRDKIDIKSKMLKEQQMLEIQFRRARASSGGAD